MASTTFTNNVTLSDAGWFNDVDAAVYEGTLPSGVTALVATGSTTLAVYNTVATTVNAFGAATTLSIGAATGTLTVNNATLAAKAITGTTGAFSSTITSTQTSGAFINALSATTGLIYTNISSTGGNAVFGIASSAGSGFAGASNYATILGSNTDTPVQIASNGSVVGSFSSTGLAVTGTLLSTSTIQTNTNLSALAATATPASGAGATAITIGSSAIEICFGAGTPAGVRTSPRGSLYIRTDNGTSSSLYVNSDGSTGWVAVSTSAF